VQPRCLWRQFYFDIYWYSASTLQERSRPMNGENCAPPPIDARICSMRRFTVYYLGVCACKTEISCIFPYVAVILTALVLAAVHRQCQAYLTPKITQSRIISEGSRQLRCKCGEARLQIPFAGDGARNPKLLLARYSRRALRCSPLHPAFVNIRGGAAYVDKPRCVALHCSFGE